MNEIDDQNADLACGGGTPEDRRNNARVVLGAVIWAICLLAASYLIRHEVLPDGAIEWLVALVPTIAGIVVLILYSRYLRETDELQREIQLKALALGFGAGWIALAGYPLLERLGAPVIDAGVYVLVMAVFFTIGNVLGWRRYR